MDLRQGGQIRPKGDKKEVEPMLDGRWMLGDGFFLGESEENAVRAHHIETRLYGGCFVSTTRSESRAILFATSGYQEKGWVYVLDPGRFADYGVISKEYPDPLKPDDQEVSIRADDCGAIPQGVIVEKFEVTADGKRK